MALSKRLNDEPNLPNPPMTTDSSVGFSNPVECTSDYNTTTWNSAAPSSAASTFEEWTPRPYNVHTQPTQIHSRQPIQPPERIDIVPSTAVAEIESIMYDWRKDGEMLTNAICLLFRYSVDTFSGDGVCEAMLASPVLLDILYEVIVDEDLRAYETMLRYATGNLANLSKYREGRIALLNSASSGRGRSKAVDSLIYSLQSRDMPAVIFAVTAVQNLLLDQDERLRSFAKEQIKHGLPHMVKLLDDRNETCHRQRYQFKVTLLDCLWILAFQNEENRITIKDNDGIHLVLRTIAERDANFGNQSKELLLERASRVLKTLSAGPESRYGFIEKGGVSILTNCICSPINQEILANCLWTITNLSDIINNSVTDTNCVNQLVTRLLQILCEYAEEPMIINGALCILKNLSYENERIKHLICFGPIKGVDLILNTIDNALRHSIDNETLEPAICALCNLMNQTHKTTELDQIKSDVRGYFEQISEVKITRHYSINPEFFDKVRKLKILTSAPMYHY